MPLSQVQPERYDELLTQKTARVSALLAPFSPPQVEVYPSAPLGFRMRAEFRVWHDGDALDYVMYRPEDRKTPVPIEDFPIAGERIRNAMGPLLEAARPDPVLRRKLFQVEFLATLSGELLVTLVYHRPLEDEWDKAAEALAGSLDAAIIGRSRRQKRVIRRDYVEETLHVNGRDYHYRQYEQAFTQPNAGVNCHMIEWALAQAGPPQRDLLELYCGNGNFTLPLASCFRRVLATEVSKRSIEAATHNREHNRVDNLQFARLSAEEVAQALAGEREFRRLRQLDVPLSAHDFGCLFVDPPRAGLDPASEALAHGFDRIIYISCNPQTLAGNLQQLCRTHRVTRFALFDQFPYTDHAECGVVLEKRT